MCVKYTKDIYREKLYTKVLEVEKFGAQECLVLEKAINHLYKEFVSSPDTEDSGNSACGGGDTGLQSWRLQIVLHFAGGYGVPREHKIKHVCF